MDIGLVNEKQPKKENEIAVAVQKDVTITATQTIYELTCGKVDVTLTFTSPLLMNNLDLMARPVTYISYKVKSNDQKAHEVDVYLQVSSAWP